MKGLSHKSQVKSRQKHPKFFKFAEHSLSRQTRVNPVSRTRVNPVTFTVLCYALFYAAHACVTPASMWRQTLQMKTQSYSQNSSRDLEFPH